MRGVAAAAALACARIASADDKAVDATKVVRRDDGHVVDTKTSVTRYALADTGTCTELAK